ncbi:MAG TPA: NmrA family NAD(P)-binding protein [Pyrinomonadaceae bacterium]|nr:NmrA family NAD(P)-binding protein [Pyrinomonadaceae bacterium]
MSKKTFAITGATGNIGSVLADALLGRGYQVRALGRSKDRLQSLIEKGAESYIGTLDDAEFLTRAFTGVDAAFTMIPPNATAENFRAYQNQIGEALATAIKQSKVTQVVNLSSIGGHLAAGTGPIKGLHDNEERFNTLERVNVIHLRPAFFMENLLFGIEVIKNMGVNGSGLDPQVSLPMIATRDIGAVAADLLERGAFTGKAVRELLGHSDLTMPEATTAIGKSIGKDDLKYVQFPYENVRVALLELGTSANVVEQMIEMYRGMNEGIVRGAEQRSAENTTPTTIDEFARTVFAPAYNSAAQTKSGSA